MAVSYKNRSELLLIVIRLRMENTFMQQLDIGRNNTSEFTMF